MGNKFSMIGGFTVLVLVANFAVAKDQGIEFSAEAVQHAPQRPVLVQQMYVGKGYVRKDFEMNGQQVIEIVDSQTHKATLLLPTQRGYLVRGPQQPENLPQTEPTDITPCAGIPNTTCKLLGNEKLNGQTVEKWEMVAEQDNKKLRTLYWLDTQRRIPLRQIFPDGTVSELVTEGNQKLYGRDTERWKLVVTPPGQQPHISQQWYDPELKMVIKEELPGGFMRELRNIRIAAQPGSLFEIPQGYAKMENVPASFGQMPPGPAPGANRK